MISICKLRSEDWMKHEKEKSQKTKYKSHKQGVQNKHYRLPITYDSLREATRIDNNQFMTGKRQETEGTKTHICITLKSFLEDTNMSGPT